ncbi:MAG: alpha/beta hydrolase [Clostridiales bacterium]|nr:alpha/beta hydrolase [Clostridiales bacterium]
MKRFLSILLAFTFLSTVLSTPLALKAQAFEGAVSSFPLSDVKTPLIVVRGVDLGAYYTDYGTEKQAPALGDLNAKVMLPPLVKGLAGMFWEGSLEPLLDQVFELVESILGKLSYDKAGNPAYALGQNRYPLSVANYYDELVTNGGNGAEEGIVKGAAERFGAQNVYYFTYDWRENPFKISDELAQTIDRALADHECDKVNLICASMGGLEAVAYFDKHGYEKIDKCVFLSAAFYGLYMVSDLFCGRVDIEADNLYNFIAGMAADNRPLEIFLKGLKIAGAFKLVEFFADKILEKYKGKLFDELLTDTLATMPVWWALILPEDYEEALGFLFEGREDEYAGIIEISKQLQTMMQNRDAILKEAEDAGVSFSVISAYNRPALPLYARAGANSDGGLETALISGGATVAEYGKRLDGGFAGAYLSPDGVIDASTCIFPDSTWFIKNGQHVGCGYQSQQAEFLFDLIAYEGKAMVNTWPEYPQYLIAGQSQSLGSLK